jgi:hypothetical protein
MWIAKDDFNQSRAPHPPEVDLPLKNAKCNPSRVSYRFYTQPIASRNHSSSSNTMAFLIHLGNPPTHPFFRLLTAAPNPVVPSFGPFFISSSSPRSFHALSRFVCVARWIPKAACWSGTTSSSSSGFKGWCCGGT